MEYLYEWMRQVSGYMILAAALLELAAGESYRKYIRMYTGIILILLILAPVLRLFGNDAEETAAEALRRFEQAQEKIQESLQTDLETAGVSWDEEAADSGSVGDVADAETGSGTGAGEIEVGEIRIGR